MMDGCKQVKGIIISESLGVSVKNNTPTQVCRFNEDIFCKGTKEDKEQCHHWNRYNGEIKCIGY